MLNEERVRWIDVLRCIGIIEIFIGHSLEGQMHNFVFSHHVALFFFVSGALQNINTSENFGINLNKKIKGVFVPFLYFCVLSLLVQCTTKETLDLNNVGIWIRQILVGGIRNQLFAAPLWFFTGLLCCHIFFLLFRYLLKLPRGVILIMSIGMYYIASYKMQVPPPALPYNIDSAMQYFVWYVCGWILFPTINKIVIGSFENISWKYKLNKACIVVVICIAVWVSINMYFQNGVVKEFGIISDNTLFLMLLSILQPLIVILWWVFVSVIFQNNIVLQNVGRNTLYLNGNEFIVRELINAICMTMGINICIDNPLQAIIQAILFITIIYKIFLSWEAKSLIIIQKYYDVFLNNVRAFLKIKCKQRK